MQQTWDNMTNEHATERGMDGHWDKFDNARRGYRNAQDLWDDNGCGGGSPAHAEWPEMDRRTRADADRAYQQNWGGPRPAGGPSALARVGWGALGVLGAVGTAALVLVPFDGPLGEAALGTATVGAFRMALQ